MPVRNEVMVKKILLATSLLITAASCRVKEDLCAAYACAAPSTALKLQFKAIGSQEDLLFSANPRYHKNDLKIKSSLGTENVPFTIDSTSATKGVIVWLSSTQTLTVKLGDMSEDKVSVTTKFIESGCCGSVEITSLSLNQDSPCVNCNSSQTLVLSK